jgi:hypothetical protein
MMFFVGILYSFMLFLLFCDIDLPVGYPFYYYGVKVHI